MSANRSEDRTEEEILRLIEESQEARDKSYLLILYKIYQAVRDGTRVTEKLVTDVQKHTDTFAVHEEKELQLIGQMRGGWRVAIASLGMMVFLLSVIQFLGYQIFQNHIQAEALVASQMQANIANINEMGTRQRVNEALIKFNDENLRSLSDKVRKLEDRK